MYCFDSDYLEGADERVMQALAATNSEQTAGYGEDPHCERARRIIRDLTKCPDVAVHFVTGGTQANLTVIAATLRPWEGVLCADTAHINVHETGAIEATGHKVLALPQVEGKITAVQVLESIVAQREDRAHEHCVKPGMVYVSHPTEMGTLYSKDELCAISAVCRQNGLCLYLDGARLGYGLAADPLVDLPLLADLCDAFTIGGTKAGLLFGEAIVLPSQKLQAEFRYAIKQRGGMLAKGRLLGVQFAAMLAGGYLVERCARANALAQQIKKAFVDKGFPLLSDTAANQVFPILPDDVIQKLQRKYSFSHWQAMGGGRSVVRFCASVTTEEAGVAALLRDISFL